MAEKIRKANRRFFRNFGIRRVCRERECEASRCVHRARAEADRTRARARHTWARDLARREGNVRGRTPLRRFIAMTPMHGEDADALTAEDVVALVSKMRELDILDFGSLIVSDAKRGVVTRDRLREDARAELMRRGGRATTTAIAMALEVDVGDCERELKALARDKELGARFLEGELMTEDYFSTVVHEIVETLRTSGVTSITDCARKFSLSSELVSRVLRERVGASIEAKLEGSLVYTPAYVDRLAERIQDALGECTAPTSKEAVLSLALGDNDGLVDSGAQLAAKLLSDVIKSKKAQGTMNAGFWYPEVHLIAQRKKLREAYERHGIVTVAMGAALGIYAEETKSIITVIDGGYVDFGSYFVAKRVFEQLETSIREALAEDGYCRIADALPDGLGSEALAHTSVLKSSASVGDYVVTNHLVKKCIENAKRVGQSTAENVLRENGADLDALKGMLVSTRASASTEEKIYAKGPKKGKKDSKGHRARDDTLAGDQGLPLMSNAQGNKLSTSLHVLKDSDITGSMRRVVPEADDELVRELTKMFRTFASAEFNERVSFAIENFGDKLKMSRELAAKRFLELYPTAALISKGTEEVLANDVHAVKYTCRQYALPCADAFLRSQMEKAVDDCDVTAPLTDKWRSGIVESFPNYPADGKPLGRALLESIKSGKSPVDVVERVATLAEAFGIRLPSVNRAAARSILQAHKKGLEDQLSAERDVAKALLIAVPYLVAVTRGKVVAITGRSLVPALEACGESLETARRNVVRNAIARVVEELSGSSPASPTIDIDALKDAVFSSADADASQNDH